MNKQYHNDHWLYMKQAEAAAPKDLVQEHAQNPRNFGDMSDGLADSYVSVIDPACGDRIELWIMIEQGRIFDIRFKSNGCAPTLAVNSMMTVLALGRTIIEAKRLTDEDIFAAFRGALEHHTECPLAGIQALHAALDQYKTSKTQQRKHYQGR